MGAQLLAEALRRSQRFASGVFSIRVADVLAPFANPSDVALISGDLEGDPARRFKLTQEITAAHPGTYG